MRSIVHVVTGSAILLSAAAGAAPAQKPAHVEWTYEGAEGPEHWGDLSGSFGMCKMGKQQSPVDVTAPQKAALPQIVFAYHAFPLRIIDNGHTVQVTASAGSSISIAGHRYELKQFHFHHPAEEAFNGVRAKMVVHLVHADASGKLAVVGVMLDSGQANALVDQLWQHLPAVKEKEETVPSVMVDPAALLPSAHGYYTFDGSLTTPPCAEKVRWFLLKAHVQLSQAELDRFAAIYPMNARPLQPLNGRIVKESPF